MVSARATAFTNQLDNAITNVTVQTAPIVRQRQNTDTVRASGLELEADIRPSSRWTVGVLVVAVTRSRFAGCAGPAGPRRQSRAAGADASSWAAASPTSIRTASPASLQARVFGAQFDDDLNDFELERYGVSISSASQQLLRGLNVFVAVENLFDADYDTGRTPLRTIGWPRTARAGVRVFLP